MFPETLAGLLNDGRPRLTTLRRLAIVLSRALESLHAHDITHGDVTPSNVLLDEDGVAHISDFGLSEI
ncbi:MAG: protein kinase [Candidatus Binatia bacterium]|nr:protein kinase [Candidatus Binatia bacterium]